MAKNDPAVTLTGDSAVIKRREAKKNSAAGDRLLTGVKAISDRPILKPLAVIAAENVDCRSNHPETDRCFAVNVLTSRGAARP